MLHGLLGPLQCITFDNASINDIEIHTSLNRVCTKNKRAQQYIAEQNSSKNEAFCSLQCYSSLNFKHNFIRVPTKSEGVHNGTNPTDL